MTPMFRQYHELKQAHPEAVLFFRMGDFYEVFYDDAKLCSEILEIALTARNKNDPQPIPMAGVPHHAAAAYVAKLTEAGHRVAIAEQVEDPAVAKGLVRREVVRVVTPGVVLDPATLKARESNHMAAILAHGAQFGVAFLDISTGDLRCATVGDLSAAIAEIHRFEPKEALLSPALREHETLLSALKRHRTLVSSIEDEAWNEGEAVGELRMVLGVADLAGFGASERAPGIWAAGALVRYARMVSGGELGNVHQIQPYRPDGYMVIDETTRRNLEISRTLIGGNRRGSLLWLLDKTATAMGSRMLKQWLAFPLLEPRLILDRQAAVSALVAAVPSRESLRNHLREVADIERLVARVAAGTAHGRDLAALRRSLAAIPEVLESVAGISALTPSLPGDACVDVFEELRAWLVDDPPITLTDGGLLRHGVHSGLSELIDMSLNGEGLIAELEEREREQTGISSLKVRKNKVFGFFIEVTRAHLHKVPERYRRKQTLSNAERYITLELKELEDKVLSADERRKSLEHRLFVELRERMASHTLRLQRLAAALAALDVLAALAEVAARWQWVAPTLDTSRRIHLEQARHPVVESLLEDESFVPNDCALDDAERRLIILTGPNMSGKSTTMRQIAIAVLLAQIGSFVPAERAQIGVCDRVFTRVGSSDDLSRGQSTFMVEMAETAAILHHATPRSLVVLDEIGRGTSTYDGLAIAWAVAEDLAKRVQCRAMFATHYHELCALAEEHSGVVNQSVAVSEWGDEIVFLRTLKEGGASRSYGIQCARLAGLPSPVIARARTLLTRFEKHAPRDEKQQLSLFGSLELAAAAQDSQPPAPASSPTLDLLATLDPDEVTPRQAHALLYQLHEMLVDERNS